MFTRKLRVLLNIHERLLCSRLHPTGFVLRVNLIHLHKNHLKSINANLKNNSSGFYVLRNSSNLSRTLQNENYDNNNNNDDTTGYFRDLKLLTENTYAYQLLVNSEKLKNTIIPAIVPDENVSEKTVQKILEKDYENASPKEILNDFKLLSFYPRQKHESLNDEKYSKILLLLKKYVQDYSKEEFKDLFRYIQLWYPMKFIKCDKKNPSPYFQLLSTLDDDCFLRLNDFEMTDFLIFCDLFWRISHTKALFINKAVKKLGKKVKSLKPEHYLQYMFIISSSRKPFGNMYELEYVLESIVHEFSGDELGIVAMAFFKTKSQLRNPLLINKIIGKTIEDMNKMGDISICATFKIIRFSLGLEAIDLFEKLLNAFRPKIKSVSAVCLVHVAHAVSSIQFYNKEIMDEIIERFQTYIPTVRIKDLERILFTLMTYNYPKEATIYKLIVEEYMKPQRERELKIFPKSLTTSLMYLSHVGIYPLSIIEKVMHPDYLYEFYRNNATKIGREYLIINCGVQIEEPEYKGPFLPDRVTRYLYKRWSADSLNPDDPAAPIFSYQRFLFEVVNHLRDILGATSFLIDQLLPHYMRQDIVFCLDKKNNFVSPKPHFPEAGSVGVIKYAPKDPEEHKWVVLVLAPKTAMFKKKLITIGTFDSKLRQLEKIGYTTLTLMAYEWNGIKTIDERKNYLRSILFPNDFHSTMSIKS